MAGSPLSRAPGTGAPSNFRASATARLSAPLSWKGAVAIVTGLLGFIAATNNWMSFQAGLIYARANDERAYLVIAKAFPGLPDERIADQHAQRWPVHWFVGGVADVSGVSPEIAYRYVAIGLAFAVLLVLAAVLRQLGASTATAVVALGVVAMNPYSLRYYGLAPGYLSDLAFDLGLAVALLGLVRRRLALVLLGLLLGSLARQTMLPVVPVVALWVALAPEWRERGRRARNVAVAAAVAVPVVTYVVVNAVAEDFSHPGVPFTRLTIIEAIGDLPDTASGLANHFAHTANAPLAIAALLIATLTLARVRELPSLFWGSLAIGLVIVAQAAALNPDPINNNFWSTNEPRLVAMALVPLAVAFAAARGAVERERARPLASAPATVALIVTLLALFSLHHTYTVVSTGSKEATIALELVTALGIFIALMRSDRRTPPAVPNAPRGGTGASKRMGAGGFEPPTSRV